MNPVCSLKEFCDANDVSVSRAYKTILGLGINPTGHIESAGEFDIGALLFDEVLITNVLSEMNHIVEPFYCDYLTLKGERVRMIIQPQRVWYGTLPDTQEQYWLMTALDLQTDEEIILKLSHINA